MDWILKQVAFNANNLIPGVWTRKMVGSLVGLSVHWLIEYWNKWLSTLTIWYPVCEWGRWYVHCLDCQFIDWLNIESRGFQRLPLDTRCVIAEDGRSVGLFFSLLMDWILKQITFNTNHLPGVLELTNKQTCIWNFINDGHGSNNEA